MNDQEKLELLKEVEPNSWKSFGEAIAQGIENHCVDWKDISYSYTTTAGYFPTTKEEFLAYRKLIGILSLKKWGTSLFDETINFPLVSRVFVDQYDGWTMSESKRKIMKGLVK